MFTKIRNKMSDYILENALKSRLLKKLLRYSGLSFGTSAFIMTNSVCPLCGQAHCVIGWAGAIIIGFFITVIFSIVFVVIKKINSLFTRFL